MVYLVMQNSTKVETTKTSFDIQEIKDPFEINMKTVEFKPTVPHSELITSKSLCTPGCGNTGTGNSFCC